MKTAVMWTAALIGLIYGATNLGPTPSDNNPRGFLFIFLSISIPVIISVRNALRQGVAMKAKFEAAKVLYEKSLFDLQQDPNNSSKHQNTLLKGREYYTFLHPNTYDMNNRGVMSNQQDNSGVIELKIQSDIQARMSNTKG